MKPIFAAAAAFVLATTSYVQAQPREGWIFRVEGLYSNQSSADLSGGSSFSVNRAFGRVGGFNRMSNGLTVGVSASVGRSDYKFSAPGPWGKIDEKQVSLTFGGRLDNGTRWFVAPSLRQRAEVGASSSAGRSAGFFAGVSWEVNDRLTIGPAFGAFQGIGSKKNDIFPAILLDWQIAERWSLTTGPTIGASQGPGLSLSYDVNDDWALTLSARRETNRFALSDSGATPGGVGQDRSVPVVLSLDYQPNPGVTLALFAGAELDGKFELENAAGAVVGNQSYGTAPIAGFAFALAF